MLRLYLYQNPAPLASGNRRPSQEATTRPTLWFEGFQCLLTIYGSLSVFLRLCGRRSWCLPMPDERKRGAITVVPADQASERIALYDRLWSVVVGIDVYPNLAEGYQLERAVRDAKAVARTLRDDYGFSEVIELYDADATEEHLSDVLRGTLRGTGRDDAVLVYFAGHGHTEETSFAGPLGHLVTHDGGMAPEHLRRNITMNSLRVDISEAIPAKHVMFVVDACYGGLLLTRGGAAEARRDLEHLRGIASVPIRQILTAGRAGEEVLDGGPGGHSVFTGSFLNLLRESQDYLTGRELGAFMPRRVREAIGLRNHKQNPQFGSLAGEGDFVLVRPQAAPRDEPGDSEPTSSVEARNLRAIVTDPSIVDRVLGEHDGQVTDDMWEELLFGLDLAGLLPVDEAKLRLLAERRAGRGSGCASTEAPPLSTKRGETEGTKPAPAQAQGGVPSEVRREWDAHAERLLQLGLTVPDGVPLVIRNEKDGGIGLWIPPGESVMGKQKGSVHVDGFYMDKYPITNGQYARFIRETGHALPEGKSDWNRWLDGAPFPGYENHPAVNVSCDDASDYCQWAGKRLPTELEWMKAARGTDDRTYPWGGSEPDEALANFGEREGKTTPVDAYPRGMSPFGLVDVAGNVWEWTSSQSKPGDDWRLVCGGCWYNMPRSLRCESRNRFHPSLRNAGVGFRCASDR